MRKQELPAPIEEAVRTFIAETRGKFFHIHFIKVDDSLRQMTCRTGVKVGIKGTGTNHAKEHGYITVYDVRRRNYRNINPGTVKEIRFDGKRLIFK